MMIAHAPAATRPGGGPQARRPGLGGLVLAAAALVGCTALAPRAAVDTSPVPARPAPSALAEGWQHGAFMEIFVRAYADSDGDGIGDLRGLTQRLDHLQRLGVRGLWLMPITANADGDHGYATTDFRRIAPEYGTLGDFDELIRQAHARGIGVIMDYVINHSAAAHPMFEQARLGPGSPFRDWYLWSDTAPAGWDIWGKNPWYHTPSQPWLFTGEAKNLPPAPPGARDFYFGTFGPAMPDFNFRNPAVLAYHLDSLRFWLNRGLDGFRLDAVPHLIENNARDWNDQPESRALTRQIQALVKSYPRRYTVCEATAEPLDYARDDLCGAAFAFGLESHDGEASQWVQAARGDTAAIRKLALYPLTAPPTMGHFISSHDQFAGRRLWDQVGGDLVHYKLAAASYLLMPGTPYIYYGEEIGQAGAFGLVDDPQIRGPMSWTGDAANAGFSSGRPFRALSANLGRQNVAAEAGRPDGLLAHYQALLALRNGLPAIARGGYERPLAEGATLSFQRRLGAEHNVVTYNYGTAPARLVVTGLPAGAALLAAYPDGAAPVVADAAGSAQVPLAAQSFAVWRVQPAAR
jgi:glycosidase